PIINSESFQFPNKTKWYYHSHRFPENIIEMIYYFLLNFFSKDVIENETHTILKIYYGKLIESKEIAIINIPKKRLRKNAIIPLHVLSSLSNEDILLKKKFYTTPYKKFDRNSFQQRIIKNCVKNFI